MRCTLTLATAASVAAYVPRSSSLAGTCKASSNYTTQLAGSAAGLAWLTLHRPPSRRRGKSAPFVDRGGGEEDRRTRLPDQAEELDRVRDEVRLFIFVASMEHV